MYSVCRKNDFHWHRANIRIRSGVLEREKIITVMKTAVNRRDIMLLLLHRVRDDTMIAVKTARQTLDSERRAIEVCIARFYNDFFYSCQQIFFFDRRNAQIFKAVVNNPF